MKKTGLLLGLLALVACEQQELEYMENNIADVDIEAPTVQTRAETSSISDFDPLSELRGIPLNIINVGNSKNKYLSAKTSDKKVVLYDKDDGSGRQRWYLEMSNMITLKKGNSLCNGSDIVLLSGDKGATSIETPTYPALTTFTPAIQMTNKLVAVDDNNYNIQWSSASLAPGIFYPFTLYLQPKSSNSESLAYKKEQSGEYSHWIITPVGNFRVIKMEYEKSVEYNDHITASPAYCDSENFGDLPFAVEHEFTIKRDFTETSYFSEAYGVTTNKESGTSYSIQVAGVNIDINGNVSESTTPSENVSFSQTTTNTLSVTKSFKMTIPSHTPCRIEIMQMMYDASLTYVATLEKTDGDEKGKQFRIKGRWTGIVASEFYFNVYDLSNNLIETSVIPEGIKSITVQG